MSVKIELLDYKYGGGGNLADATTYTSSPSGMFAVIDNDTVETFATGSGIGYFNNFCPIIEGVTYKVSFKISSYGYTGTNPSDMGFSTSGGVPISLRGAGNGTYEDTFTAIASGSLDLYTRDDNSGYITQISVTEVAAIDWESSVVGELDVSSHEDFPLSLTFSVADIKKIESKSGTYSKTFKIPATANNNRVLKNVFIVNSNTQNLIIGKKKCRIMFNNLYSLDGLIKINEVAGFGESPSYYSCVFFGDNLAWSGLLDGKKVNQIDWGSDGEGLEFNKSSIEDTWTDIDCTTSVSPVVYPLVSYGKINEDGTDGYIQLLDTAYNATGGSSGKTGYYGYWNNGTDYGTPPPSLDWRPAVWVKPTIDKIFRAVGYEVVSSFMDTDLFKRLIWLLPNVNYTKEKGAEFENIDAREVKYSGSLNLTQDIAYPNYSYEASGAADTGSWVYNVVDIDAGIANTVTNSSGDLDMGDTSFNPDTEVNEFGVYSISATGLTARLWNITHNNSSSGNLTVNNIYVEAAIQVKTVGQTSWNDIISEGVHIEPGAGYSGWAVPESGSGSVMAALGAINIANLNVDRYLNKGDKLRTIVRNKITRTVSGVVNYNYNIRLARSRYSITFNPEVAEYGQTYDLKNLIDSSYTQMDFIKGISHAFNLQMTTDETAKKIYIEPFIDFFEPVKDALDWTYKLDRSKEIKSKWIKSDLKRDIVFKYKSDDKDERVKYRGEKYFNGVMDEYPYSESFGDEFESGTVVYQNPFFSGTSAGRDADSCHAPEVRRVYSSLLWEGNHSTNSYSRTDKGDGFKPRLLYWDSYGDGDAYKYFTIEQFSSVASLIDPMILVRNDENIPIATSGNRININTPNLCYGNMWVSDYNEDGAANTLGTYASTVSKKGLYETYYKGMIESLKQNPRIIIAYIDLKITDVVSLDFRRLIYINGVYYRLSKVIDFNPQSNNTTKVELVEWKVIGEFPTSQPSGAGSGNPAWSTDNEISNDVR